jgi:hypothetical protein
LPDSYEIEIRAIWTNGTGLKLTHLDGNETLLSSSLSDQSALDGMIE